jgi:hypothetical protein
MITVARIAALVCMLAAQPSHAIFRVYVGLAGNDSNPCTLGAPCRTIAPALAAVDDGGQVWLLDSANYNLATVQITKSVTIEALPGAIGSFLALGGPAFNVATSSVKLVLRNLVIRSFPGAGSTDGVHATAATSVIIDKCTLSDLPGKAVFIGGALSLQVRDSEIRNAGSSGIELSAGGASATLTRVTLAGNYTALEVNPATGTVKYNIRDSLFTGNVFGIDMNGTGASSIVAVIATSQIVDSTLDGVSNGTNGTVFLTMTGNVVANNKRDGIYAPPNTTAILSDNTVAGNIRYGLAADGNAYVAGTNVVKSNGTDTYGNITGFGRL